MKDGDNHDASDIRIGEYEDWGILRLGNITTGEY